MSGRARKDGGLRVRRGSGDMVWVALAHSAFAHFSPGSGFCASLGALVFFAWCFFEWCFFTCC